MSRAGFLSGPSDDAFLTDLADRLGGIPLPDDLRGRLLALGGDPAGKRAIAQILVAGPGYQAR